MKRRIRPVAYRLFLASGFALGIACLVATAYAAFHVSAVAGGFFAAVLLVLALAVLWGWSCS